jgi:acetyltransferase (GNAT) family protein
MAVCGPTLPSLCNVDFEKDVAFVAVTGPRENEEIVGTRAHFLNPSTNLAKVAYMIVPERQGSGLGGTLQQLLKEFAVDHGVRGFVAEVLQTNAATLNRLLIFTAARAQRAGGR